MARTNRNQYPLRRVVGYGLNEHGGETETLECGHVVPRLSDIYGPTNAFRRRCRQCFDVDKPKPPGTMPANGDA